MANGFTYCWSDHSLAKVYVGVHLGNPDDGYICSSKTMLSEFQNRPNDFTREILFSGPYDECAKFEVCLIKALFKTDSETYYNRSVGKKILFDDHIKEKISKKLIGNQNGLGSIGPWAGKSSPRKGVKASDESRKKMSDSRRGMVSPNKGKKASEESRRKMSLSAKGRTFSDATRLKLANATRQYWANKKLQNEENQ